MLAYCLMENRLAGKQEDAASSNLPQPLAILKTRAPDNPHGTETTYYILGTAHVSTASCQDVVTLIRAVKPEVVMVELCVERKPILSMEKVKEPALGEVLGEIRRGRATPFQGIYSWLLAKVGKNLEVMPGEEFRVALREAHAVGAQVVLGDRPLTVTLARVWHALSLWEKVKLTTSLLWTGLSQLDSEDMKKEIERMKESDVLTEAIREFGKEFPSLIRPLLSERDEYMVYIMRKLALRAKSVVAVVGAGHLQGIRERWNSDIDIAEIMDIPAKRRAWHWRRVALIAASSVLLSTALFRIGLRR